MNLIAVTSNEPPDPHLSTKAGPAKVVAAMAVAKMMRFMAWPYHLSPARSEMASLAVSLVSLVTLDDTANEANCLDADATKKPSSDVSAWIQRHSVWYQSPNQKYQDKDRNSSLSDL